MRNTHQESQRCPTCGGALPAGVLDGLCPRCLLAASDSADHAAGKSSTGFVPPGVEQLARLFPQLEILGLLGAGGMGAVYKARQPALDRFVALKILPARKDSGVNFAERFNREARALARLSHPNIVAVHEFGQVEGQYFFIMEFVDGANLRQLERNGRLSAREALQIVPQICDALQYAHDESVVHRDIKPENVLVDRKGRVKIADFGLAKILGAEGEALRLTAENQVMGTPHYMAPEQVERPLAVDHRADIYSLGVVFYEMLTGDLPLGKFAPPSRKVQVDVRLDEVVLRALENDPGRRYQRVSEVRTEVETIAGNSTTATTANKLGTVEERFIRWAGFPVVIERNGKRSPYWPGALVAAVSAVLLMAATLRVFNRFTNESVAWVWVPYGLVIAMAILGVFRALNAKARKPVPAMTSEGTVILPARRWRLGWSHAALAGSVVAGLGWAAIEQDVIKPWMGIPMPATAAREDSKTGRLTAKLPEGPTVELMAISEPNPAPNGWWSHDGRLMTNEFLEVEYHGETSSSTPTLQRNFLIRYGDLPEGASGPRVEFEPYCGFSGGGLVFSGGKQIQGVAAYTGHFLPEVRNPRFWVGFDYGPWQTVGTHNPKNESGSQIRHPADRHWESTVHRASENNGKAQITVLVPRDDRRWVTRVVALDTNGVERFHNHGAGTPIDKNMAWTYTFQDVPLAAVREFQVQVRPMHWAYFGKLRLDPVAPPPVSIPARFGPTVELTLTNFINFDNGELGDAPAAEGARNLFDALDPTVKWMEGKGFDAAATAQGLHPRGMIFALLKTNAWENTPPSMAIRKLNQGMFVPQTLNTTNLPYLPATLVFRTRDGATGMLELKRFEPANNRVDGRYKLVQRREIHQP